MTAPLWFRALSRQLRLPVPRTGPVTSTRDVPVPMADDVSLLTDLWRPAAVEQPPVLLVRTPYGRSGVTGLLYGRFFAHQGFHVLVQSCRGTAGSGGAFDRPFLAEAEDGEATVTWLINQPWYPGSFATVGASYLGYTQLAVAAAARGHHRAAVLQVTPTSVRDVVWPGDELALHAPLAWSAMAHDNPAPGPLRNLLVQHRLSHAVRTAGKTPPLITSYRLASGDAVPYFEDWLGHPEADDPWWRPLDHSAALEQLDCRVLVQAGWYDMFLESSLQQFQRLRARGVDAELTVGPWSHLSFGSSGVGENFSHAADFLRNVMGLEGRSGRPARVRLTEIGSGRQQQLPEWPVDPISTKVFHLASGRLAESPEQGSSTTTFRYDPADPTPNVGGATLEMKSGARDNRELERREDVRTFDSEPLGADLHLLGSVVVRLRFESDRAETAVFFRLCRVGDRGRSINITDRLMTLSAGAREADGSWQVEARLPATSAFVPAGHRLRLQVSSGAFPQFARHPGTSESSARATVFHAAQQVIHHSEDSPATLHLPLAGDSRATQAAASPGKQTRTRTSNPPPRGA